MNRATPWEHPRVNGAMRLTAEQRDFLRRRTRPFLDSVGVERPLPFLLEEAYLQGMRDAAQTMQEKLVRNEQTTLLTPKGERP